jgi:Uncharacterized conserved protein
MSAFIIGQMQIHIRDWMEACFACIQQVVADRGGSFVGRGGSPEAMEGAGLPGQRCVSGTGGPAAVRLDAGCGAGRWAGGVREAACRPSGPV